MSEFKGFEEIELPMPPLGGKIWLLDRKGQFVLERGPGTLRSVACTCAGSGTLLIIDGLPDENGEIPLEKHKWKPIFKSNPVVMGAWPADGGFNTGLTIRHYGGQDGVPGVASIIWLPYRGKKG